MNHEYKYQTIDPYGQYVWQKKSFKTRDDLFKYLIEEKEFILSQKKSIFKKAEAVTFAPIKHSDNVFADKKINIIHEDNIDNGTLKRTVIANTYFWLDSHSDVHIGKENENETGIFTESIQKRINKIYPIDQHNYSLDGRIGKTLALYEAPISWRALGLGKTGMTEALFAVAQIEKAKNERRYNEYLNDEIDQHSVGMFYGDVQLAVADGEKYPKENKVYQKYISKIGNRQEVEAKGYFFAVTKATLVEYSAVIAGSNELTPTLNQNSGESDKSDSIEPQNKMKVDYLKLAKEILKT